MQKTPLIIRDKQKHLHKGNDFSAMETHIRLKYFSISLETTPQSDLQNKMQKYSKATEKKNFFFVGRQKNTFLTMNNFWELGRMFGKGKL